MRRLKRQHTVSGHTVFTLALLVVLLPAVASAALKTETLTGVRTADGKPLEVASGQLWVKFSSSTAASARATALVAAGGSIVQEFPNIGWTLVSLPVGLHVSEGLSSFRAIPGALAVEASHVYRPNVTPNDPLVTTQYALSQINAFSGWEFDTGSSTRVTIAMIDAGIEAIHPDLQTKLANTISMAYDSNTGAPSVDNPPSVACNHGTRTSGIAAAVTGNGLGVAGVSWGAQLVSLRVFDIGCPSDCNCITSDVAIINAINYAVTKQTDPNYGHIVINMSIGGNGPCSAPVQAAMNVAVSSGIPFAVSAGNGGSDVETPANCAGTIGGSGIMPVGATDSNNNITGFSSRGPELAANGVVAPGQNVTTTDIGGGYATNATGTSFSAPHVAGLAALILSAKPTFTAAQVQSTIRSGADSLGGLSLSSFGGQPQGNISGAGRIDVFRSMRLAVRGTLADFVGDQKAIPFPNPFRVAQDGSVSFTIPLSLAGLHPSIKIYTIDGRLVKLLPGLTWDGRNTEGNLVASGTYIFLVSTDNGTTRGRLALVR